MSQAALLLICTPPLPTHSEAAAQAAVDARNARYSRRQQQSLDEQQQQQHADEYVVTGSSSLGNSSIGSSGMWNSPSPAANAAAAAAAAGSSSYPTVTERLELAEKVAERFVASKIKPALRRASERDLVDLIKDSGSYLKGFWIRLNGGGVPNRRDRLVGLQLPLPLATKRESELVSQGVRQGYPCSQEVGHALRSSWLGVGLALRSSGIVSQAVDASPAAFPRMSQ